MSGSVPKHKERANNAETLGDIVLKAVGKDLSGTPKVFEHFTGDSYDLARGELRSHQLGNINTLANILHVALELLRERERVPVAIAAIPRPDLIPVTSIEELPDGVKVAVVASCTDHNTFFSLPGALEIGLDTYGKSGWNSDRQVAYYRTDVVLGIGKSR